MYFSNFTENYIDRRAVQREHRIHNVSMRLELQKTPFEIGNTTQGTVKLKRSINLAVKQRILHCYVFPVAKYSCESWTLNKELNYHS